MGEQLQCSPYIGSAARLFQNIDVDYLLRVDEYFNLREKSRTLPQHFEE